MYLSKVVKYTLITNEIVKLTVCPDNWLNSDKNNFNASL